MRRASAKRTLGIALAFGDIVNRGQKFSINSTVKWIKVSIFLEYLLDRVFDAIAGFRLLSL
jgi:hypothetical protein